MTYLDWRTHKYGTPRPCRVCSRRASCRDAQGTPCHKVCAEKELNTP